MLLEELVIAAQQGDSEAYGRIVVQFQDMAYYTAFRYLGDQQQAEDAAQDAFIEAHRCLPALQNPQAFPSWLRRIIFKQCDRQTQSKQPLHLQESSWQQLVTDSDTPDQMLEQLQLVQAVRRAVHALPNIYREVTQLFYLNGRSQQEIAEQLDLPISTVKKRLYTARQHLKEQIDLMTHATYQPSQDNQFTDRIRFYMALKNDDLIQTRQLLRRNPDLLQMKTEWGVAAGGWYWPLGSTPLHYAASVGNLPMTKLLVGEGADLNIPDQGGSTPLKQAAQMGQAETAVWLLQHGADANAAASNGQTALHVAVIRNRPDLVALLLQHGADFTIEDSQNRSPLAWAIAKGFADIAKMFDVAKQTSAAAQAQPTETASIWETGIKILDLIAPLKWGGRNGLFTPTSGIGADVMIGDLIYRMATYYDGFSVQVGLEHGDFTEASRRWQWQNYGVNNYVELLFGQQTDSPERQHHLLRRAVKRVKELAMSQPVLFIVYTHLDLDEQMMAMLDELTQLENVTLLFAGVESVGAEPNALGKLDAAFTFDRLRAKQALWPAIDIVRSYSNAFENDAHRALAETAVRLGNRFMDLYPIYENQGMAGFDLAVYGDAEREDVTRGRYLHSFLAQSLFVAETWSATLGEYVTLDEAMAVMEKILHEDIENLAQEEHSVLGNWSPRFT